eukprot:EC715663.1.p1 GENE.EC715663.1~~EC715663.1.p1  ORF type:complete len:181 (+),score=19.20 EC715663.1:61-543(+)
MENLIVVDISPVDYPRNEMSSVHQVVKAMSDMPLEQITNRKQAEEFLESRIPVASTRQFALTNLVPNATGSPRYTWRCNLSVLLHYMETGGISQFPFEGSHPHLNTLAVYGTKSRYVQSHHHSKFKHHFPRVRFAPIDADHWVHAEQPHTFIKVISDFLC